MLSSSTVCHLHYTVYGCMPLFMIYYFLRTQSLLTVITQSMSNHFVLKWNINICENNTFAFNMTYLKFTHFSVSFVITNSCLILSNNAKFQISPLNFHFWTKMITFHPMPITFLCFCYHDFMGYICLFLRGCSVKNLSSPWDTVFPVFLHCQHIYVLSLSICTTVYTFYIYIYGSINKDVFVYI